jgi:plastocyanin
MMPRLGWGVVVGALLAVAVAAPVKIVSKHVGASSGATATGVSANATVHMAGLKFSPGSLVVRKDATVTFDNNDVAPHTVTEDNASVDSGVISPSKAFHLVVERSLVYHCTIHPFMKATINLAG